MAIFSTSKPRRNPCGKPLSQPRRTRSGVYIDWFGQTKVNYIIIEISYAKRLSLALYRNRKLMFLRYYAVQCTCRRFIYLPGWALVRHKITGGGDRASYLLPHSHVTPQLGEAILAGDSGEVRMVAPSKVPSTN